MAENDPIAFLSYVRADDEHDRGRITALRGRLEGEVRMHTGKPFPIFQDKKDIKWGQQWKERLDSTLLNVTFLIPIVTPSYFQSSPCRDGFNKFLLREQQLGESHLILPIYYLTADEFKDLNAKDADPIAKIIASRNWADWRSLRFLELASASVEVAINDMAATVKSAMKELQGVIAASKGASTAPPPLVKSTRRYTLDISNFSPIPKIVSEIRTPMNADIVNKEYYVFTNKYDEIILANELSEPTELTRLSKTMKKRATILTHLHRLAIDRFVDEIKTTRAVMPSITILVDNSGSMRGDKSLNISAWLHIMSKLFQDCGLQSIPFI
jgi:cobaltochelatase CobT